MKRLTFFSLAATMIATGAFGQPPEEVPPPPPDQGTSVEQPPPESQPEPVAEPKTVSQPLPPAAAPDDPRLKGVVLSPSVTVLPIGYDSIDITGSEGGRYYFGISPSVSVSTALKTDHDRKVDFSGTYVFRWREYYNKTSLNRDLTNVVMGSLGTEWNDILSTNIGGLFEHFFKSGTDNSADNYIYIESYPNMGFKVSDQLKFNVGYGFEYLALLSSQLGPGQRDPNYESPTDPDDFGRGATGSDISSGPVLDVEKETEVIVYNFAVVGTSYSPIKGTSLGFTYKYEFYVVSNNDSNEMTGHWLIPSISQELPWKGGSVSLANQLRFRKYKYDLADRTDPFGSPALQKFRNRLTLQANQAITDAITFSAYYRLESNGKNSDDYERIDNNNQFYLGVTFGF